MLSQHVKNAKSLVTMKKNHHKLQHYHDTIIHYARRYHGELQERQRKMNQLSRPTPSTPTTQQTLTPTPTDAPSVTRTPTDGSQSSDRFFRQD